ncbi:cupin domain-containing protein [Natronococcus pandeyae]|uniref:Cupin domain-containing protein n=1 Tax=Natronococcus pandeyae TaxID=2055836 RepID=A0A8J8Q4G3_9EURY|nr:cupin domain-containing protein [Natronococcus pandeyae]TYL40361.1 cupin domain-containing protein [Natronococcus pandeyae]
MATTPKPERGAARAVDLYQFDGTDAYQEGDERARLRGYFPLSPGTPNASDVGAEELMLVCIEIEPGNSLPSHRDSNEELLVVIDGAVEATIGDETIDLEAGQCAVVPELEPHGLHNAGDETARILGFFPDNELTATFEDILQPFDSDVVAVGPDAGLEGR